MVAFEANTKEAKKYIKSQQTAAEQYIGIEHDADDMSYDDDGRVEPYDVNKIRIETKGITIFQIEVWIKRGLIDLAPDFQRHIVWDHRRRSLLIESLLLRIPIPAVYVNADETGKKTVIDGIQRLTAIDDFIKGKYALKDLQYLSDCEGKKYSELGQRYRLRIEETLLTVNILDERCPQMVKFDVFRRINTGGVPLNPQEIRNILAKQSVRGFLQRLAASKSFKQATDHRVVDTRMDAQEMWLRMITIFSNYDWRTADFKKFTKLYSMMDEMLLSLNEENAEVLEERETAYLRIMRQCQIVLGEQSFYKFRSKRINKQLFTAWCVVLLNVNLEEKQLIASKNKINKSYMMLLQEDDDFKEAITSSTGGRKYIKLAIDKIREIIENSTPEV